MKIQPLLRGGCPYRLCIGNPDSLIVTPGLLVQTDALRVHRIGYEYLTVISPRDLDVGITLNTEDSIFLRIEMLINPSERNYSIAPARRSTAHVCISRCHVLVIWRGRLGYGEDVTSEGALDGPLHHETHQPQVAVDGGEAKGPGQERMNRSLHCCLKM